MNTRFASVETLKKTFGVSTKQAQLIRALVKGGYTIEDNAACRDYFPKTFQWIDACYHNPLLVHNPTFYISRNSYTDVVLEALNELLDGFGIEPIRVEDKWIDSYYRYTHCLYVNQGDSYTPTIGFDTQRERFFISCWEDMVFRFDPPKWEE